MARIKTSNPKEIFAELEAKIKLATNTDILVGIPENATAEKDGESFYLADIATINNFGSYSEEHSRHLTGDEAKESGKIPPRPFGSTLLEVFGDPIKKFYNKEVGDSLKGKRPMKQALNRIGFIAAGFMKQNLSTGKWAANAESTIARKGSSKPLIDTGEMRRAITWVLKKKGGKDVK
jgi:hypothetical protein